MISPSGYKFYALSLVLALAGLAQLECGGSTGAKKPGAAGASPSPAVVEVSTAPAILRQLPRFFEATGSLAANEQTDVAPSIAGKVVAIGVDLGSFVRRGQMIVRLDPIDSRLRLKIIRQATY